MNKHLSQILALVFLLLSHSFSAPVEKGNIRNKVTTGDNPLVKFNRITLPIFEAGQIGNSVGNTSQYIGVIDTIPFLYSSGFLMSGYTEDGTLWTNGVEPVRKILDYKKGTVENPDDSLGVYRNSIYSIPFGEEWQNWKHAVLLGAEFYDGDNDGIYNPIDLNKNGVWDENEDRPALYGDVMTWSAFNDGIPASERAIDGVEPLGINIRQTVWAYQNNPNLEKVVFIKYKLENTGKVSPRLLNVNFAIAADPDIGYYRNDFLATDVSNNSILTYTPYRDYFLHEDQIAFAATMIQGPLRDDYSSGYQLVGEDLEENVIANKENCNIAASVDSRYANFPVQNYQPYYPDFIKDVMLGNFNASACSNIMSEVNGANCSEIDNHFIFSGNPISQNGWINNYGSDKEFILTTESFDLIVDDPVEIIYAYVIGSAPDAVDAMKEAIYRGREVKYNFFHSPQPFKNVEPISITDDESIELLWYTYEQVYNSIYGYGYDINFEGFEINMYNSQSTSEYINGTLNKKLIAKYDIRNGYDNILVESSDDFSITPVYEKGNQMYGAERLLLKISWDPFNNEPLKKGKPYYFSITPFGIDKYRVKKYGIDYTYLVPSDRLYAYYINEPQIINDNKGNVGIVLGENINDNYYGGVIAEHLEGNSNSVVSYSVYDQNEITEDLYEVSFENYESEIYALLMQIKNVTKNYTIQSTIINDDYTGDVNNISDGILINVDWVEPGKIDYTHNGEKWFNEFDNLNTGIFYVGSDISESQKIFPISLNQSRVITINDLRNVELRFADTSMALRYVRTAIRYPWKGEDNPDSGFVKIPVSAYSIDRDGTEKKLQIAFIENAFPLDSLGTPDGIWNPGTDIVGTKEYLVVFNSEFTENLEDLIQYTGTQRRTADIANGFLLFENEEESDSIRAIARSPWFNAMYVVGFTTPFYQADFNPTGTLNIKPSLVLTEKDKYYFKVKHEKTLKEKEAQFEKINVYPNPLFGYNANSNAYGFNNDEPFVTFSNLPNEVNVKIFSLAGNLIRTLYKNDGTASLRWDLKNESNMRIASGMYIAIIDVPKLGQKVLKFAIIQPQKGVHY